MEAVVFEAPGAKLRSKELSVSEPGEGQVRVMVHACGVCRTDIHLDDGDLPDSKVPVIPGHQIVGTALRAVAKGGIVVCAGIHMSDISPIPYHLLRGERQVRSVANLTRRDSEEFLELAAQVPIQTQTYPFRLSCANDAIDAQRDGTIDGIAVLEIRK